MHSHSQPPARNGQWNLKKSAREFLLCRSWSHPGLTFYSSYLCGNQLLVKFHQLPSGTASACIWGPPAFCLEAPHLPSYYPIIFHLNYFNDFLIDLLSLQLLTLSHYLLHITVRVTFEKYNLNHSNSLLRNFQGLCIIFWVKFKLLTMACKILDDLATRPGLQPLLIPISPLPKQPPGPLCVEPSQCRSFCLV